MKKTSEIIIASFFLLTVYCTNIFGQISYPDSCLKILFYNKTSVGKLDTFLISKQSEINKKIRQSFTNPKVFNLFVKFQNVCNGKITVPSDIKLGTDFWVECIRVDNNRNDTIDFSLAVDYLPGKSGSKPIELAPYKSKLSIFDWPFALKISEVGEYRFRVKFFNAYNYIPYDSWKTYYSNWVHLKVIS